MLSGHFFQQIRPAPLSPLAPLPSAQDSLLAALSDQVVDRFARVSGGALHAIVLTVLDSGDGEHESSAPCHPACGEHAGNDYCRESWQLHLAALKDRPETHWHKCDLDRLCAVVPIVARGCCVAAVKLAAHGSIPAGEFERQVEILDLLVKDFVTRHAAILDGLASDRQLPAPAGNPRSCDLEMRSGDRCTHPQIRRAFEYIEGQLGDPKLTVGRIAHALGIHPNYLSQLFAEQVGQRMSQFITARRVELAKTLLATTDWQIKRIAGETGHANPNWFCRVFSVHTGLAPGEFRRRLPERSAGDTSARPNRPSPGDWSR
jgi:AraC-like DNA-binding protein